MIPGEVIPGHGDIEINAGRPRLELTVRNTGDRPIQVGSHYHFAEANASLDFDREAAWGHRLAVPAGTSVRFEPGMPRDVVLVPLAGNRVVPGLRGLAGGPLDATPPGNDDGPPDGDPGPSRADAGPAPDPALGGSPPPDVPLGGSPEPAVSITPGSPSRPENGSAR